ncbi:MATE family efflux transporter [soil metagenome]
MDKETPATKVKTWSSTAIAQTGIQSIPVPPPQDPEVRAQRREILRLAIPAFLALIAEPVFLLVDSAIVGYLGTASLAGLGVATAVLLSAVGIFVFLAYGSTSVVARRAGAGDLRGALGAGIDGIYLAALLGIATTVAIFLGAQPIVDFFNASPAASTEAVTYLAISAFGIPPMLVVFAATGVLRGLQDTTTPLIVAVAGFSANAVLSLTLVHGVGLGIAGAAWGSVAAQTAMALALTAVVLRGARREQAPRSFHPGGVFIAARGGIPLLIRTLALRGIILATTWVAAGLGDADLAAFQVSITVWHLLVFALDALAIAGQAITGKYLGAGDLARTRAAMAMMIRWGVWFGVILAVLILATHRLIPLAFSADPEVRASISAALVVLAVQQPIAAIAFVLDGVLMGAGDMWWLAIAQVLLALAYLPMLYAVWASGAQETAGLVWLWVAFSAFMAIRSVVVWLRSRSDAWMVTGATR